MKSLTKLLDVLTQLLKEIPTMIRRLFTGSAIAALLLLAFATSVAAHEAFTTCESITTTQAAPWTVDITRTDVEPDLLVWDNQPGNGTYAVRVGTYKAVWSDGVKQYGIVVGACEQPSPTPTPDPSPTPFVWIPPTAPPDPTPTPQASPTPTPTPAATPTPEPTPTEPPSLTPPPTDMTAGADVLEPGPVGLAAALVLVLMAAGSVWLAMRRRA